MNPLSLLHGKKPDVFTVIGAHLFGVLMGGYVLSLGDYEMPLSLLLFAVIWNMAAGLVLHASEPMRSAWRRLNSRLATIGFVLVHVIVYPPILFWLIPEDVSLLIMLHAMLLAKILVFVGGRLSKGASPSWR
jgi:uncharacterized membrane protein